ncbi:MAG: hypothetical protein P4L59_18605 [Desulfosporosinus sp.]|nr:hypothetical protein [Desulfosporosinus sp.]
MKVLILALLDVLLLAIGHAYSSQVLLWGALIVFSVVIIVSHKGNFLPLMLFYLPWSPVLKPTPNSLTFATVVVPVVFLGIIAQGFNKEQKYKMAHIVLPLFFTVYTIFVKLWNELPIDMPYLFFIIMLFFIPLYVREYKADISFERCALFLTVGILTACVAAQILMNYPHMLQYIVIDNTERNGVTRLSGFYGDANYYSAQILVAIAALLTVMGKTKSKTLVALQIASIVTLLYFGMLSVSKMFMLSLVSLVVIWLINLLLEKRSISNKLGVIVAVASVVGIVVANNLLADEISLYFIRFGMVSDTSSLTTGRSDLWQVYINYLLANTDKLFLGIGVSPDQVRILLHTNNAHNSLIEIVYQLGLMGVLFLWSWWKGIYRELVDRTNMDLSKWLSFLIMAVAVLLPWFALDVLFFHEFFYFILLLILAKRYLAEGTSVNHGLDHHQTSGRKIA